MIQVSRNTDRDAFVIATEVGLLHRLRRENPGKRFIPANPEAVCPYMNRITLEKIRTSLRDLTHRVEVPEAIREAALRPLERMVAIG
jgi:quinolinate synthase